MGDNHNEFPHVFGHSSPGIEEAPETTTVVTDIPWPPNSIQNIPNNKQSDPVVTQCGICLEEDIECTKLYDCPHAYCRNCLVDYCNISLQTFPIQCPHERCNVPIRTMQVQELLPDPSFQDHLKHYWLQQLDALYHECPLCSTLLTGGGTADYTCAHCQVVSCRRHGRIHAGMSCRQFQSTREGREWDDTEHMLRTFTKPCSHCGVSLQKASGCDHLVCGSCHQDMCWKVCTKANHESSIIYISHCQCLLDDFLQCGTHVRHVDWEASLIVSQTIHSFIL